MTAHKQRVLNRLFGTLNREIGADEPAPRPVFEQLVFAICREAAPRDKADAALQNLRRMFFDWNEIRVSSVREVEEALAGLSDAGDRAARIISILQEVFESTYSFDLESLHKKTLQQAEKQLQRYQGTTAYAVAYTLQHGLDGHSLPLDEAMQRTLRRLEVLDDSSNGEAMQASLEHLVPKARGSLFCELVSAIAEDYCHATSPLCSACPMNDVCPTAERNARRNRAAKVHAKSR